MENSWGKARVQHLTCAHQFLDMIHATPAALSGNTALLRMKGGCCALRDSGEITGKLLLSRGGGWSTHQRGHRSRREAIPLKIHVTKLLAVAFRQGKMSQPVFVLQVPLPLTDTLFLPWLRSSKDAPLRTHRDTACSLRY